MSKANGTSTEISIPVGRFPYVEAFKERYGVDRPSWLALTNAIYPNATSLDSIIMALSYCKARGLDPFKRPVHIVPMWNSALGQTVDTIWPGIGELRTTAVRTGVFAGRDAAVYGPTVKERYGEATLEHPEWCEVVVYRMVEGHRVACHGPRVYWRETYASKKHNDPTPNSMWMKRPFGQIEKCAEAGALRAAFPEEIGNEYTADEMEGKVIEGQFQHVASAPAAVAKPTQDRLSTFAGTQAPDEAPPQASSDENAVELEAALAKIAAAKTYKALKAARNESIPIMGKFDETWPEGKQQIVDALAQAEQAMEGAT